VKSGVAIYLSGAATAPAITDADGNFSFTGLANGTYTLIPVLAGYTFSPVCTAVVISGADVPDINFVATANILPTYNISGTVTGAVLSGVTITLSGAATGTTTTDASGNYSFTGLVAGDYTLTPSLTVYTFTPSSLTPTVVDENIIGQNFAATVTFTQADLTGTWKVKVLTAAGGWLRSTVTIDADGIATFGGDCEAGGEATCPSGMTITWAIDTDGVISQSIEGLGLTDAYYTMTLNKNFIAGTSSPGGPGSEQFLIVQKDVPETVYSDSDLQGKTFVFHQLSAGYTNEYQYMTGNMDDAGEIYISSMGSPSSQISLDTPMPMGVNLLVNSDGIVTTGGDDPDPTFKGFLSADKKTIVSTSTATDTDGNGNPVYSYQLMIIQITEPTFTLGPVPAGTYSGHFLGLGGNMTPFWVHSLFTVSNSGRNSFSDWVSSNTSIAAPAGDDYISIISPSGTVKRALNDTFHGQMSSDGMFIVGTQTREYFDGDNLLGFYSFGIDIRTNGAVTP
jgi:hypothetical protein